MGSENIGERTETELLEERMKNLTGKLVLKKCLLDNLSEDQLKKMGHDLRKLGKDRRIPIAEGDYLLKTEISFETCSSSSYTIGIIEGIISGRRVKLEKGEKESTESGYFSKTVITFWDGGCEGSWTSYESEEDDDIYDKMSCASKCEEVGWEHLGLKLACRDRQLNWAHDNTREKGDKIVEFCTKQAEAKHYEELSELYETFAQAAIPISFEI